MVFTVDRLRCKRMGMSSAVRLPREQECCVRNM